MSRYAALGLLLLLIVVSAANISLAQRGTLTSSRYIDDIRADVDNKLDLGNSNVEQTAVTIAKDYPGENNINQVCTIFDTLRKGWFYFSDPIYANKFKNANHTLQDGKISGTIGMGNCDDFAILMASLIASLGGSTRITLAANSTSSEGHAYCEVFLGNKSDLHVNELVNWTKAEYNLSEIPGLNKTDNEVWMNLDWWADNPGGSYFEGDERIVVWQADKLFSPKIVPIIDTMDSTTGWKTIKDDKGSNLSISSYPARKGLGIDISYDLKEDGWVGISKNVTSDALSQVEGLNFSVLAMDKRSTIELRMAYADGTEFGYSLKPDLGKWEYLQALYRDFKCLGPGDNCSSPNNKLDPASVKKLEFVISNHPGDETGSGKIIVDHVRGVMNIPAGSPWAKAEIQRRLAAALDAEAASEVASTKDFGMINAAEMDIASLKALQTPTGLRKTIQDLNLLPQPLARLVHNGPVNHVTFSPDGKILATGSDDDTARIWNAQTGQQLAIMKHGGRVLSVVFSPDGTELATASADGTASIWDLEVNRQLFGFKHNDIVLSVAFSPDGTKLATASNDSTARLWDAKIGTQLTIMKHDGPVLSAVFSPDGSRLATASWHDGAKVWDVKTGIMLAKVDDVGVNQVAFSPDGRKLATASIYDVAKLWDAQTGQLLTVMRSDASVSILVFSPDGRKLATASIDGNVRLWNTLTGQQLRGFKHEASVSFVVFSPDGTKVATASSDHTAIIWDPETGEKRKIMTHQGPVLSAAFSPDATRLATASQDHSAMIWDVDAPEQMVVMIHDSPVYSVAYSPDGTKIATASFDGTSSATIWDARTGERLLKILQPGGVWSVAFSPDGKSLAASANWPYNTSIWNAETSQLISTMKNNSHKNIVLSVAFSPDGSKLATASNDTTARLWDTKTGGLLSTLKHNTTVWSVAFNPNGTEVATGSGDGTTRVWDVNTGERLATLNYTGNVYSVAFSPDGTRLATACAGTICIWDAKTSDLIGRCIAGLGIIHSLAFSPDGTKIATGSSDHTSGIWDIQTGNQLEVMHHDNDVSSVAFSPDGTRLATASYDKTARIWAVNPDGLICETCQRLMFNLTSNDFWGQNCGTCSCSSSLRNLSYHNGTMKAYDKTLELNQSITTAWFNKGNILEHLGKHDEAIQSYDQAIQLRPNYPKAWNNKGLSLASQGKDNESIQAYDKAIKLNHFDPATWNNKGLALSHLGKYDEALQAYNKSIELNPNMAEAWFNKGNTLKNLSRYHEAIYAYDEVVIFLDPNNAWAWLNEGIAWDRLGMEDTAIQSYNHAIAIDPNNPEALNTKDCAKAWVYIATALAIQGKYNDSINSSNKSIELNPRYANAWVTKGLALFELGKYNESIQAFDKAIELKPTLAPAWNYKGNALKLLGKTAEAEAALTKAEELGYKG